MSTEDEFKGWTDEALLDYEERLYDDEVGGDEEAWHQRERVILELQRRELPGWD